MDGYNYQINEPNESDFGFINRNDFHGNDVDQVLFEAQDSLLNSMEQMGGCPDSTSFLSPINDILNDINEFNKNFCDQGGPYQSLPTNLSVHNPNNQVNSWALQENTGASPVSYSALSDAQKLSTLPSCDDVFFNINPGNEHSVMIPDSSVEFPSADCAYLGTESSSTANQWFQGYEQHHMSLMAAPINSMPITAHGVQANKITSHGYSDKFLSTIGSLPASTTITPITVEDQQLIHRPVSPLEQELTIEARYGNQQNAIILPSIENINKNVTNQPLSEDIRKRSMPGNIEQFAWSTGQASSSALQKTNMLSSGHNALLPMVKQQFFQRSVSAANSIVPRRLPTIGFQKNHLHWTAVFPRKHFIQPPEMIIMQPLRTRKLMSSRRPVNNSCGMNSAVNLSAYFDTSSISIPMITERNRADCKDERTNRRKQRLQIIPGSENLVFEVQQRDSNNADDFLLMPPSLMDNSSLSEVDPYPETELPELDEIFRRKKKTVSVPTAAGSKRNYPNAPQAVATGPPLKKSCSGNISTPQVSLQETSASFEEKVSVSIAMRKGRSNLSSDKNNLLFNSESSDSEESDDNGYDKAKTQEQITKSLKCQKCRKLFKTIRSLSIHTKRCKAEPSQFLQALQIDSLDEEYEETVQKYGSDCSNKIPSLQYNADLKNVAKLKPIPQGSLLDVNVGCPDNTEDPTNSKLIFDSFDESKARPITRSQTRRSSGRVIPMINNAIKRLQ